MQSVSSVSNSTLIAVISVVVIAVFAIVIGVVLYLRRRDQAGEKAFSRWESHYGNEGSKNRQQQQQQQQNNGKFDEEIGGNFASIYGGGQDEIINPMGPPAQSLPTLRPPTSPMGNVRRAPAVTAAAGRQGGSGEPPMPAQGLGGVPAAAAGNNPLGHRRASGASRPPPPPAPPRAFIASNNNENLGL